MSLGVVLGGFVKARKGAAYPRPKVEPAEPITLRAPRREQPQSTRTSRQSSW